MGACKVTRMQPVFFSLSIIKIREVIFLVHMSMEPFLAFFSVEDLSQNQEPRTNHTVYFMINVQCSKKTWAIRKLDRVFIAIKFFQVFKREPDILVYESKEWVMAFTDGISEMAYFQANSPTLLQAQGEDTLSMGFLFHLQCGIPAFSNVGPHLQGLWSVSK